ncbi:MAG: sigma-70 family RNA polymerase sigma factor [Lachnobacterium sp.]|nr:sigma-70 family RNA polymerase sigma factor [Lachnobacterium sp.]MCI7531949.1 sigma-70 family RNA polymerase sigma factor [Lachnobacterium sp.]MDD7713177.1 sigma-70 family RNA polymerase sigma factor [Lachnobacterium sp.]MDY5460843.1 sigma-70 family RNA polymerase sigma factor [Agathobacter sp.]
MPYEAFSDEELIEKLRQGENDITDYILEKYKPLVRKKTNAMYLIGGETEDLIQEGMIGLFKAIRDYRPDKDASFYHFAELCINRQLYSALEASNRKKHQPLNSYISLSDQDNQGAVAAELLVDQERGPEQMVIEQELWEEYKKRLEQNLSKMENKVLQYYLDGNHYIQIAEIMGKSPKSIDNALQRIRQKIRQIELD